MYFLSLSVDPLFALGSSAVATDLVRILRRVKLVVETQLEAGGGKTISIWRITRTCGHEAKGAHLLSFINPLDRADDDFVTPFKRDHLGNTVWGARVVDVSGKQCKIASLTTTENHTVCGCISAIGPTTGNGEECSSERRISRKRPKLFQLGAANLLMPKY